MSTRVSGVSLTDVRRFAGKQQVQLSRVNLLVGENSVGKTTFLGCVNGLGRLASLDGLDDRINSFAQAPFDMVSFETIARSGCNSFAVELELDGSPWRQFAVEFGDGLSGTSLTELRLAVGLAHLANESGAILQIDREIEDGAERWAFNGPGFEFRLNQAEVSDQQFTTWLSRSIRYGILPFGGDVRLYRRRVDATDSDLAEYGKFINFFRHRFRTPTSPLNIESIEPRGLHPRRFYASNPLHDPHQSLDLAALSNAGRELGLFNRIEVRETRDAFEVLVDVSGSLHNICDVGYGVSSLLPFLSALTLAATGTLFLLQQPEVHLHPSAQAQLARTIAGSGHAFIVETHSDHVIDWFRILVKEGKIDHTDVAIIYFETIPDDSTTSRLHQITLDERANLTGQPQGYREFFSQETARLLGLPV